jgi:hypothetical protein
VEPSVIQGSQQRPAHFTSVGDVMLFTQHPADGVAAGPALFRTDGTNAGTERLWPPVPSQLVREFDTGDALVSDGIGNAWFVGYDDADYTSTAYHTQGGPPSALGYGTIPASESVDAYAFSGNGALGRAGGSAYVSGIPTSVRLGPAVATPIGVLDSPGVTTRTMVAVAESAGRVWFGGAEGLFYIDASGASAACGGCSGPTEYCDAPSRQCVDDCAARACGPSPNSGFDCGTCSGPTAYCEQATGRCIDDCASRECGLSPQGFVCGTCSGPTTFCDTRARRCVDDCASRTCGASPVQGFDCGACDGTTGHCSGAGVCEAHTQCQPGERELSPPTATEDRRCTAIICSQDERVSSNQCIGCPPGTERPADPSGDDATGPDTVCDPVLCAADERVSSNACAACPPQTTNPSGDDASGPDTTCTEVCQLAFGVSCASFEEGYLKSEVAIENQRFGDAVALDGDTVAVGAPYANSVAIFTRSGTTWTQQQQLAEPAVFRFGRALSIQGDTLAVGSEAEKVRVYTRVAGVWSLESVLTPSVSASADGFGRAVALDGDSLVVGAEFEDSSATGVDGDPNDNGADGSGAAYLFERVASVWTQTAYLKASNTGGGDRFGFSVDKQANTIVVGSPYEQSVATGVGGDQSDDSAYGRGAVYVFVFASPDPGAPIPAPPVWHQEGYLKATDAAADIQFGHAVALDGDRLAIGPQSVGTVYLFSRSGTYWSDDPDIDGAPSPSSFGASLALEGDVLAVGDLRDRSTAVGLNGDPTTTGYASSGAAYVYLWAGGAWTKAAYIKAPNNDAASASPYGDQFGMAIALSGNTLAIGAPAEDSDAVGVGGDPFNNDSPGNGAVFVRVIGP